MNVSDTTAPVKAEVVASVEAATLLAPSWSVESPSGAGGPHHLQALTDGITVSAGTA
jgi:hypothetical protein